VPLRSLGSTSTDIPLTLRIPGYTVPAMLTLPTSGAPAGAVLLVPGSLFSDVNGDYPAWHAFPRTNAFLAEQMAARGLAVYRFAKLGSGTGSEMVDADAAASIRDWAGRMTIARLALDHFRADRGYRGVRRPRAHCAWYQ
jgi:hypothetical protein